MTSLDLLPPEILHTICLQLNPFDRISVAKTFNRTLFENARAALRVDLPFVENALRMSAIFVSKKIEATTNLIPSCPGYLPAFPYGSASVYSGDYGTLDSQIKLARICQRLGLDPSGRPYIRTSPPDLRSWARLDGSFDWIAPICDTKATGFGWEDSWPVASTDKVQRLVAVAKSLGLELPPGFEKFLQSGTLQFRFASSRAWYFRVADFVKCPAVFDGDGKGYVLRFHCGQQPHCGFAFLYLRKGGQNCVFYQLDDVGHGAADLTTISERAAGAYRDACQVVYQGSDQNNARNEEDDLDSADEISDSDSEIDRPTRYFQRAARAIRQGYIRRDELEIATSEGVEIGFTLSNKDDRELAALSFEEYLFMIYFEEQLNFVLKYMGRVSEGLKEYVARVYKSHSEIKQISDNAAVQKILKRMGWVVEGQSRQELVENDDPAEITEPEVEEIYSSSSADSDSSYE